MSAVLSTWIARLRQWLMSLRGRMELRRTAHSVIWLLADRVVRLGGALLMSLWIARYLGPTDFGLYNYALALSLMFVSLSTLGLDGILVRDLVRSPQDAAELLGTSLFLRLCGAFAALGLACLCALLLRPGDTLSLALTALMALGGSFQAFTVIDMWFQSQVVSRDIVLARMIAFLTATLLRVGLLVCHAPLLAFAAAFAIEATLATVAAALAYTRLGGRVFRWRIQLALARRLLADSWPLIFSGLLINLYLRIDQVMLGQLVGDDELGVYSVAVRLAEIFPLLITTLITSIFPVIVAAREQSEELFYARLQQLYAIVVAVGYAIALPMSFLAPWLVTLLFGPHYAAAAPMLIVLSWASLFTGLGLARSTYLSTENLAPLHMFTVLCGCLLNILLNWLFIPLWGGLGAAFASLIAYWFAAHGSCYLIPQLRPTAAMISRALVWPRFW